MLHASRSSGKTTRAMAAINQLENLPEPYCCLWADFQNGVEFDSKDLFWSSFSSSLRRLNSHVAIPPVKSAEQFCDFLSDRSLFGEKPVVMFIDEFDKLYNVALEDVTNSVMDTFRSLKNNKRQYCSTVFILWLPLDHLACGSCFLMWKTY